MIFARADLGVSLPIIDRDGHYLWSFLLPPRSNKATSSPIVAYRRISKGEMASCKYSRNDRAFS